jgi:hypothetical protein
MPQFPSVEWFQALADRLNASGSFQRLGSCDAEVGIQVGDRYFEVDFDAFEITGVREIDAARAQELDFVLVQSPEAWRAMIEDIRANGRATGNFTLNSLDSQGAEEFARGQDYHRRDLFYRYNQTFQEYFDQAAKVDTVFA